MIGDNYEKSLPVKLTEDELRQYGQELARLISKKEEIEGEKKLANSGFKERVDEIEASMKRIGRAIAEGREWRMIECFEVMNGPERKVEVIRNDTQQIVSRRDPTQEELQKHFFRDDGEEAKDKKKSGKK